MQHLDHPVPVVREQVSLRQAEDGRDRRRITPPESRALTSLDSDAGRSMSALADEWRCDPSNATWLVDRLESQGLARRVAREGDRRVKAVVLTAKGKRMRAELLESM